MYDIVDEKKLLALIIDNIWILNIVAEWNDELTSMLSYLIITKRISPSKTVIWEWLNIIEIPVTDEIIRTKQIDFVWLLKKNSQHISFKNHKMVLKYADKDSEFINKIQQFFPYIRHNYF